jgi:hypothetical protein
MACVYTACAKAGIRQTATMSQKVAGATIQRNYPHSLPWPKAYLWKIGYRAPQ